MTPRDEALRALGFWWHCVEASCAADNGEQISDSEVILHYCEYGTTARVTAGQLRAAFADSALSARQEVAPVAFRGYAKLGIGAYLIEHSAESEPAALMLCIASEDEKAGRTVGDLKTFEGERQPIPAEKMAVRIDFANVAGLDALEQQLRILREVHFPTSPAQTSEARGGRQEVTVYYVAEVLGGDFDNVPISMFGDPAIFSNRESADKFCDFASMTGRKHEVREIALNAAIRQEAGDGE